MMLTRFLSTTVPEDAIFIGTVGRTVLGSEGMLFHLKRRVESSLDHVCISFRLDCVLLEGEIFLDEIFLNPVEKIKKSIKFDYNNRIRRSRNVF